MDIALFMQQSSSFADIQVNAPDLEINKDLQSAVIISLFANRLADVAEVPHGDDRKGWWGDTYAEVNGSQIGSKLWLLKRSKNLQSVVNLAREYCLEALQWLIDDQVADSITVRAESIGMYTLGIEVNIYQPKGVQNFKFSYVWSQI